MGLATLTRALCGHIQAACSAPRLRLRARNQAWQGAIQPCSGTACLTLPRPDIESETGVYVMTKEAFTLTSPDGHAVDLQLLEGTAGTPAIDVRGLNREQGVFAFDPAFTATCSCKSNITYIDGANGLLTYRGYPVDQLAEQSSFLEVCYLLLYGELPQPAEHEEFVHQITEHTMLNQSLVKFFDGFHYDAHPMAVLTGIVGSLSAFYHDATDIHDPSHREIFARRMIAKMP